jgi:hypothetical protein
MVRFSFKKKYQIFNIGVSAGFSVHRLHADLIFLHADFALRPQENFPIPKKLNNHLFKSNSPGSI